MINDYEYIINNNFLLLEVSEYAPPILKNIVNSEKVHKIMNAVEPIYLLLIFVICTSYIIDGSFNPFLYFRF